MKKIVLSIDGMTCSACSNGLEKYLNKQSGIKSASVNLVLATANIEYDEKTIDISKLEEFVKKAGFKSLGEFKEIKEDSKSKSQKIIFVIYTILAVLLMYISMGHMVKVDNGSGKEPTIDFYGSGDTVTITAHPSTDYYFDYWKVKLLDSRGQVLEEDISDVILGTSKGDDVASFIVPETGKEYAPGKTYPDNFGLKIEAQKKPSIMPIVIGPNPDEGHHFQPTVGDRLSYTANVQFYHRATSEQTKSPYNPYNVTWTYQLGYGGDSDPVYPAALHPAVRSDGRYAPFFQLRRYGY